MNAFLGRNFEALDPLEWLVCSCCGKRMTMVAFVTDAFAIRRILDHLGPSTPEAKQPPPIHEVIRVAEQDEGWGVPAQRE
jgi:hypothetical protein